MRGTRILRRATRASTPTRVFPAGSGATAGDVAQGGGAGTRGTTAARGSDTARSRSAAGPAAAPRAIRRCRPYSWTIARTRRRRIGWNAT